MFNKQSMATSKCKKQARSILGHNGIVQARSIAKSEYHLNTI